MARKSTAKKSARPKPLKPFSMKQSQSTNNSTSSDTKTTPVPWGGFAIWSLSQQERNTYSLMCYVCLPFGRHHIHCDLFAPRRHKCDCYWHVICTPRTLCAASRASTFITYATQCFGARHINHHTKYATCMLRKAFPHACYSYIRISGTALQGKTQVQLTTL